MKIFVGLGNPGKEYEKTNHNVGFRVLDNVAHKMGVKFEKKHVCNSMVAVCGVGDNRIILAKPQTYMNNSGVAVKGLIDKYKINPQTELFVISDDFDTKEGTIRIRTKSGNTTHNGVRSIKNELKTNEFIRIKVSIAPKPEYIPVADFVLSKSQNPKVEESERIATEAVVGLVNGESLEIIMGKFSK